MPEKANAEINGNLIVTQSLEDKSLVKGNHYLKLTDFKEEILSISQGFSCNYILKHPNLTETQFLRLLEVSVPNLEVISGNACEILSSHLRHLTSISSSLLEEANILEKTLLICISLLSTIDMFVSIKQYSRLLFGKKLWVPQVRPMFSFIMTTFSESIWVGRVTILFFIRNQYV